ncbi:hypothetical protein MXD62_34120 [Frankia sp. Mgl5]|uniref:hypothetical protein n=1 Tax=Frankia sp. Mgl5 TaxID=2933793 RepID=UPI00200BDE63|nr:hypothetical protein [Frankia sp. Mgl5]MCK9932118.1 hypothetical protein [Frankia sp. Mgl5]
MPPATPPATSPRPSTTARGPVDRRPAVEGRAARRGVRRSRTEAAVLAVICGAVVGTLADRLAARIAVSRASRRLGGRLGEFGATVRVRPPSFPYLLNAATGRPSTLELSATATYGELRRLRSGCDAHGNTWDDPSFALMSLFGGYAGVFGDSCGPVVRPDRARDGADGRARGTVRGGDGGAFPAGCADDPDILDALDRLGDIEGFDDLDGFDDLAGFGGLGGRGGVGDGCRVRRPSPTRWTEITYGGDERLSIGTEIELPDRSLPVRIIGTPLVRDGRLALVPEEIVLGNQRLPGELMTPAHTAVFAEPVVLLPSFPRGTRLADVVATPEGLRLRLEQRDPARR